MQSLGIGTCKTPQICVKELPFPYGTSSSAKYIFRIWGEITCCLEIPRLTYLTKDLICRLLLFSWVKIPPAAREMLESLKDFTFRKAFFLVMFCFDPNLSKFLNNMNSYFFPVQGNSFFSNWSKLRSMRSYFVGRCEVLFNATSMSNEHWPLSRGISSHFGKLSEKPPFLRT